MTDTITIQVPVWLALLFYGLFGIHGAMQLYIYMAPQTQDCRTRERPAMTTKEQVAQIAKQAGIPHINACGHSLERFAALVRNQALEDAAQVHDEHGDCQSSISEVIRNMKDNT